MYHHAITLRQGQLASRPPVWLLRMSNSLAQSVNVELGLLGNAKNWLQTGLGILWDHYDEHLKKAAMGIRKLPKARGSGAWEYAVGWVKKNLKTIRGSTILATTEEVESLLGAQEKGGADPSGAKPPVQCQVREPVKGAGKNNENSKGGFK